MTLQVAEDEQIRLIFNVPYMPKLMGIEYHWRDLKHKYKRKIGWHRVNKVEIDNVGLVQSLI